MAEVIADYAATLALALASVVMAYLGLFLRKVKEKAKQEISKMKEEQSRERFRAALDQADRLATTTVKALEQTLAKDIRAEVKSGKLGREKLLCLARNASARVYANMKPEYLKLLKDNMNDVNAYIMDLIESKVPEAKEGEDRADWIYENEEDEEDGE